ncbi:IS3 family transposase [Acidipropionibacterium jensenii]|uniref:IS3 family transposase n=1 Tax=Acidipropionibacterium jensenii TaxID=1749 RepID=UPI001F3867EC|nr:IS3 family transposase [Acidipropionibacterium jensenii]
MFSQEGNYPVRLMCRCLTVSPSRYYDWRARPISATARRRRDLASKIRFYFADSDGTYGYRRIAAELARAGEAVHPDTVRSIMRAERLVAAQPRLRVRTTIPADDADGRPDLVERDFTAAQPGYKWVGDITYIRTLEGFCYLAKVLDCCTKRAVGYAIDDHMRTGLICRAIDMAVRNCEYVRGATIFHSDHGSQYMSKEFTELLESYDIRLSVGRTGLCWDNAWAESFNATLKNERVHRVIYRTRDEAVRDIVRWIELRYNQKRLHSSLGYRTPNEIEAEYRESRQVA